MLVIREALLRGD
jgi:dynein heavy chain, axonemal